VGTGEDCISNNEQGIQNYELQGGGIEIDAVWGGLVEFRLSCRRGMCLGQVWVAQDKE